jgi:digeranylgeranylglycerophospholipid reductase
MPRCDAVVVGAGPAGGALSYELAGAGFEVVVLEREEQGRDKPCGEGVQLPGLSVLSRMGVFEQAWRRGAPFRQIRFESGARAIRLALAGIAIARTALDELVADTAARAGACIRWNSAAVNLARKGSQWEVTDAQGNVWRAPWIVGADGAHSWLRRRLQVRAHKRHDRAGWVFHAEDEVDEPEVRVLCGPESELYTVPIGMHRRLVAWLGPAGKLAAPQKPLLKRTIAKRLQACGLSSRLDEGATVAPIGGLTERGSGPGWLLLGDAAGQIDPILGVGISSALTGGVAAAHALRASLHARSTGYVDAFAKKQARRIRQASLLADAVLAAGSRPALWPALQRLLKFLPDLPETMEQTLFPDEMEHEYALPNLRPLFAYNS